MADGTKPLTSVLKSPDEHVRRGKSVFLSQAGGLPCTGDTGQSLLSGLGEQ